MKQATEIFLVAAMAVAIQAGCRDPQPESAAMADTLASEKGQHSQPLDSDDIGLLKIGMTMDEAAEALGGSGTALSVPAVSYNATYGGSYYLAFFDLTGSGPGDGSTCGVLHAVLYTGQSGAAYYVLPAERAGKAIQLPKSHRQPRTTGKLASAF